MLSGQLGLHLQCVFSKRALRSRVCHMDPSPNPGWINLNFDGSFNQDLGRSGIGGLIRDPFGNMLMAFTAEAIANTP